MEYYYGNIYTTSNQRTKLRVVQLYGDTTCRVCNARTYVTEDKLCLPCLTKHYTRLYTPCLLCRKPILRGSHVCAVCYEYADHMARAHDVFLDLRNRKAGVTHLENAFLIDTTREVYANRELVDILPPLNEAVSLRNETGYKYHPKCPGFYFGSGIWDAPTRDELLSMNQYGILTRQSGQSTKAARGD